MSKKYVSVLKDSAATPGYRIIAPEDYVYTENGTKKVKKIDSKADKKVPATAGNLATLDSTGNLADSGKQTTDFMNALTTAYEASGSATKTVTKVTQAKTGAVTVTYSDIQSGTTSQKGLVQLENSTSSTSTTTAATPNSVKSAYDLANGKYSKPSGGIPSSDMDSTVQASLGKADTAIQGVKLNGSTLTPSSAKVVDLGNLKTKQTAVSDPSASGTTITAIATISQDANGVITATKKTIQSASQSQDGVMSAADKTKLDGIATGAEVNQNAFSNVKVGDVTVAADAKTDTLTLAAGSNVTITPDATNDKITIAAKDTTYTADAGIRLDGTVFKHTNSVSGGTVGPTTDTAGATLSVPYVTYDSQGHVTASGTRTHNVGTASTSGAGIVQLQDSIDATTTKAATPNAVKKAIEALDVSSVGGSGKYISAISESDGKISATATTMDTTPTASSNNAVTSGGIKTALDGKQDALPTSGTASDTYAINISGNATTAEPRSFVIAGSGSTRNCWAKVATCPSPTGYTGHLLNCQVSYNGYAYNASSVGHLEVVYHSVARGAYLAHKLKLYDDAGTDISRFDAKLVRTSTNLELWCRIYIPDALCFVTCINRQLFVMNYADSGNRSKQLTDDEFSAYCEGNEVYGLSKYLLSKTGTSGAGSTSTPVYVNANGNVQECTPSSMSVGSATTATNYASGGGIDSALSGKADKVSITGATKCKITYNSQGIVTAGADLANTDLPKFIYNCGYASTRMNGAPVYDSSTPYKLIGKCSYNTNYNTTAWERFLLMYANTLFEFKLYGSWSSQSTTPSLSIHPITLYGTSLDTTKTRFYPRYSFTQNAAHGLVIEFYVMFTGDWQNYRLYQLPAQSGDVGATEFNAFTMSTNATAIATLPNTAIDFYNGDDKVTVFGHISSADKATQDSDGNTIKSTYLKLSGGTMTGRLVNTAGVENAIQVSHGTANTNSCVSMVRTDTGTQMYVGVGSGGYNHGVYSNTNGNWIIKASNAGKVTINDGKATSTVAIGNSDIGSTTKPVYLDDGIIKEGSTYAGGTAVTLNGSSMAASTASFYAPTGAGTADYVLKSNGSGAPSWVEKAPKASAADSAAKLTTARKTYVTLGTASTTTTRDWSGDTTIPVDGTLPIGNGGTGATTAANARTNLSVYSKSEVDSMLTGRISVVASLPAAGEPGVIYFVGPTGSGADRYEEYIWDGSAFIKVGEKSLDLSNYVNTLSSSGTGSVVTSLSKSGNTLTANLGNIAIGNLSDWATVTDVTISSTVYHTYWPIAPTSSNDVYGLAFSNGRLIRIRNNKGTYSARSYDQDNNTTYTNLTLGQGYGTCSTAASTVEKAVTMSGYTLLAGGIVAVKFANALCASATMNIDTKGAKPIYIKGAAVTAGNAAAVSAGDLAYFMYDGTAYHFLGTDRAATNPIVNITRSGTTFTATRLDGSTFTFTQQDNNTTYTQEKLGQGYGTCSTAEATAAKVVALTDYELVKNGVVAIKFSYGLCSSATLNINSKGAKAVFINGAAATATTCKEVQAGDIALFIYDGTQYQFLVSDRVSKSAITGLSVSGKTITYTRADASTGTITTQDTTYTFDGTYNASTNKAATVSTVTNAINALDVSDITGFGAGKTLATLTETDGKIAATFQNISITKSQVSDFSHAHGNITNGGAITATGVALASGDSLVFVDSSDSSLVKKTSITFDGSTTTKALTQKGTWETFNNYSLPLAASGTRGGIQIGYSESGTNYAVKLSSEKAYVTVPWTDTKQNVTLATTTKAYLTGVSTAPTSTAQALTGLADTGVYLTTTAGELNATQYKVNEHCTMKYNSTKSSLDFTFS